MLMKVKSKVGKANTINDSLRVIIPQNVKQILQLEPGDYEESKALILDRLQRRQASQPIDMPSAGSVFRNPSKELPSGKIIEDLGLKGKTIGGAQISTKHANFIVNINDAKSCDIKELIKIIKEETKKEHDIDLVCEQEIVEW